MKKGFLILANGEVFECKLFGATDKVPSVGELVFTTGMCGYIETLTDPSYLGQTVIQTFPQIGNYGVIGADYEGKPALSGYVVREWCDTPSNFRSEGTVDAFLAENGIVGICDLDTRQITRIIRENGVMNAVISDKNEAYPELLASNTVKNAVNRVSCKERTVYPISSPRYKVVLYDYGAKKNIIRELNKRGCEVIEVPFDTTAEEISKLSPDGIMLSNGPGDPAENVGCIDELKKLFGKYPIFGICLGHQLLALAAGGVTAKLKYGHRGANQPVKYLSTGRTYITSQNHGYAVSADSLSGKGVQSFVNANDGTCEGMDYPSDMAFSVQFHPEACAGPQDTSFLFDRFIDMMGGKD